MFKNIVIYRLPPAWTAPALDALEAALEQRRFVPCGSDQVFSSGWVTPRPEDNAARVESIGGQWLMKFASEKRVVPAAAIKQEVEARCKDIFDKEGRTPGRREKKDLKETVAHEFLPRAFSKHSASLLWLDPINNFLVIGAGSSKGCDGVIKALLEAMDIVDSKFHARLLDTVTSPSAAMALWLREQDAPAGFTVDRECELAQSTNEKAVVRYARHNLDISEIVEHISNGKVPTKLALTYDGRVSFILTDMLQLKKIEILDAVKEDQTNESGFDAEAALAIGELQRLIPALIEALGGERV